MSKAKTLIAMTGAILGGAAGMLGALDGLFPSYGQKGMLSRKHSPGTLEAAEVKRARKAAKRIRDEQRRKAGKVHAGTSLRREPRVLACVNAFSETALEARNTADVATMVADEACDAAKEATVVAKTTTRIVDRIRKSSTYGKQG